MISAVMYSWEILECYKLCMNFVLISLLHILFFFFLSFYSKFNSLLKGWGRQINGMLLCYQVAIHFLLDNVFCSFIHYQVVVTAFITWLGWSISGLVGIFPRHWIPEAMDEFELALQFGVSVLVVALPCALGLLTPTAIMVATGKGASQGLLFKGGNALEKVHKVRPFFLVKAVTV